MDRIMIQYAKEAPEAMLTQNMERSLREYMKNPCQETKDHLTQMTMLLGLRLSTEHMTVEQCVQEFKNGEKLMKLIDFKLN
jgi:hypothetical protein